MNPEAPFTAHGEFRYEGVLNSLESKHFSGLASGAQGVRLLGQRAGRWVRSRLPGRAAAEVRGDARASPIGAAYGGGRRAAAAGSGDAASGPALLSRPQDHPVFRPRPAFASFTTSVLEPDQPAAGSGDAAAEDSDDRVLISQIEVTGADDDNLRQVALGVLTTKPNFTYTPQEVKEDVERVFNTGFFSSVEPTAEDTRDGVKLTIEVKPNAPLTGVVVTGANTLPESVITEAFGSQQGKTLNFKQFSGAIQQLNSWYEDRGILGQVLDADTQEDGVAHVKVAEALVGQVNLKFVPIGGGEPTSQGNTRPEVILRHLSTRPGRVYSLNEAKRDLDAVYAMGIADDVNLIPTPAEDSTLEDPKVDLTLNIVQRKTGGLSAGGGLSASGEEGGLPRIIGSFAYNQRNLFNRNQKFSASVELGQVESSFQVSHTDPWVKSDPYRTSRTCNLLKTRSNGNAIHGKVEEDSDASQEEESETGVSIERLCGGVEYQRPLGSAWSGSAGLSWQRARCINDQREVQKLDRYGCPMTFSGKDNDNMAVAMLRMVHSGSKGDSQVMVSAEQALPLRSDWLSFGRASARAERTIPMGPSRLLIRGRGGTILGDLPAYEAFPLGGASSVRGWAEGGVGTARHYIGATTELIVPLLEPMEGAVFVDYASDLDSGRTVLGDPAGARGKPGSGYGIGVGIRVESPFGPLRLDWAFNEHGRRRFHLGIGSGG